MKHFLSRLVVCAVVLFCSLSVCAYNIKGYVYDGAGEPMMQAAVRLLAARDSAFVKGTTTNVKGQFTLADIKSGNYIIEASYIGYDPSFRDVKVSSKSLTIDSIIIKESSVMLKEVSVTGVKTQIKVMEDTIEYNADTYKTQPNSVVEDLLKRLPGVEVDNDGKITANGQEVKKILVDGKEFFSDDPKVASKNLPVEMVEKLQVVNRKSDLARLTGVDDGEDETVINLTVKKDMKNGWFGSAEAGYGTSGRYNGNFNINRFWKDNQVTFLGNFNNINQLGFTDSNGNRFRRFGGTNGINTSQAFGVNFNVGNKEIFRVGGNVMYSHSDRDTRELRNRQYLFVDSTSFADIGKYARDRGNNIRADFRVQWNPDSFNTLEFRPNMSVNINDSESADSTFLRAGDPARSPVRRSFNTGDSHGNSFEFGGALIYNHKFRNHPGRSFSVNLRYNHSNVNERENSYSRNLFYLLNDSIDLYDQYTTNHTWSDMAQMRLTWTEPLGNVKNGRFLTFAYRLQYRWNNADKLVYDHPILYPEPGTTGDPLIDYSQLVFNDELSNRFRNDYSNQDIRVGFRQVTSAMNLDVGMSLVPTMSKSEDLINSARNIPARHVLNYAPYMRLRLKMSKVRSMQINYNGRSSQPSISQLQPVADVSDPMHIIVGNPDLKPTFSHNMMLRFQDFNAEAQRSIMLMGNFSLSQNSIVSKTISNPETGGQTTTYANVNGVWSANMMNMVSFPFGNKAWQFSNHIFGMYNQAIGFNNGNRNRSGSFHISEMPALAFRPDNLELELRPRYSLQNTTNTIDSRNNMTVHSYGGTFSAYYYTPINIILSSDISFSATKGYAAGYDRNQWLWNATISYQALHDKSLTLSARVYDILQQRSNISRSVSANYIDDINANTLTRYFMFSVSYRFNTFGKGRQPEGRGGGRGFGPGPGGPGGPPPGGGRGPR